MAYKRSGLYPRRAYKRNRRSDSKLAVAVLIKMGFAFTCFQLFYKLQSIIIRIQSGLITETSGSLEFIFSLIGRWSNYREEGEGGCK